MVYCWRSWNRRSRKRKPSGNAAALTVFLERIIVKRYKIWKGGRVVYCNGLENRRGRKPSQSSNLCLSANKKSTLKTGAFLLEDKTDSNSGKKSSTASERRAEERRCHQADALKRSSKKKRGQSITFFHLPLR